MSLRLFGGVASNGQSQFRTAKNSQIIIIIYFNLFSSGLVQILIQLTFHRSTETYPQAVMWPYANVQPQQQAPIQFLGTSDYLSASTTLHQVCYFIDKKHCIFGKEINDIPFLSLLPPRSTRRRVPDWWPCRQMT